MARTLAVRPPLLHGEDVGVVRPFPKSRRDSPGRVDGSARPTQRASAASSESVARDLELEFPEFENQSHVGREEREFPAVAVCARCGDPSCPGHDFEQSGERPIFRLFPWEDGATPFFRALYRTAIASSDDLELWVRTSRTEPAPLGSAFTFAVAAELLAVTATCVPLLMLAGGLVLWVTGDTHLAWSVSKVVVRLSVPFVPLMIAIHVVWQLALLRGGNKTGRKATVRSAMRAGLFACGWDVATGPLGVLVPLLRLDFSRARARIAGNSTLFRDASDIWLRTVHGTEEFDLPKARRTPMPWMIPLVLIALLISGWTLLNALYR